MARRLSGLLSKLYDFWSPHIDAEEMGFFRQKIVEADGKVLELACSAGRLLLPFLKEGFDIEGVESSQKMIGILREKAKKAKLAPILHHQRLEDLDIRRKYRLIILSMGSFQLISDPDEAKLLIEKCYRMLEDGCKLVVAFFLPWSELPVESGGWRIVSDVKDRKRGVRFVRRENIHHDPVEQLIEGEMRFEMWQGKFLLELEQKPLCMRWYSKGECEAMFKEAGFKKVEMQRSYSKEAPARPSFMLFIATK